jgi:hypothetical protein
MLGTGAIFGVATTSVNVAIQINKGDGTPIDKSAHSALLQTAPVLGHDTFHHKGSVRATIPFTRVGSTTRLRPGAER